MDRTLAALGELLQTLAGVDAPLLDRLSAELNATRYHLHRNRNDPIRLAIFGGTGVGKSTLLNRLLGVDWTATSFRRTFTAGAVAIVHPSHALPDHWLGLPLQKLPQDRWPVRGEIDSLIVLELAAPLLEHITLIDTPDLDGDQPAHHAQADRVFRWADAALFLVTPEKYQLPDLLPYVRLAKRYALPTLHVMNKAEEQAVIDDFAKQTSASVFAIPRDSSAYEPAAEQNLQALRQSIAALKASETGQSARSLDFSQRLHDQLLEPMTRKRRALDRTIASLRAMETPETMVDVHPLTQQLQRRLQRRSVLYLMGPGRLMDRVRQMPSLLARLPRSTWELIRTGHTDLSLDDDKAAGGEPDFRAILVDQFTILQSRIDDAVRASLSDLDAKPSRIDPSAAGEILDSELADLKAWLEQHWHATPRDTAILHRLLKAIPGGKKLTEWSEAAPYLLALVVATHHAFFGHIDLLIIGGFSAATWLSEKISNQVTARTRRTNDAIARRFGELAHRQIEQTCAWLDRQAPSVASLESISDSLDAINQQIEAAG